MDWQPIVSSAITVAGIVIGVWRFNKGQKDIQKRNIEQREHELEKMQIGNQFEAIAKFKELQSYKYKEATEVISSIIYSDEYNSTDFKSKLKRFWQLYWVELSAVEDAKVESAMVKLGNHIELLEQKSFQNITEKEEKDLRTLGYAVAQEIKESSKNWELPKNLRYDKNKNINN